MFFQKARLIGKNSFFDFTLTVIITLFFYIITSIPFILYAWLNGLTDSELTSFQGPFAFALMLFVFAGLMIGIFVGTRYYHQRPILSVLTGADAFRWKHMLRAGGIWFLVLSIMEIFGYIAEPDVYTFQFDPIPFFFSLLVGILILPIQTSAEEIVMRGYLMQQIGLLTRFRWVPLVITSVLFGLLHAGNPEVLQYGMGKAMTLYIGMGLFFGVTVVMDDGLEIPLGVHYVNNFFAFLLVGYKGSVFEGTPTLFLKESEDLTLISVFSNLIVMFVVLLIFKHKFKWPSFSYIYKRINGDSSTTHENY